MSNEGRIERWRARRQAEEAAQSALPGLDRQMAVIAAAMETLAHPEPLSADELLKALLESLRSAPRASNADRRRIYDALSIGLDSAGKRHALDARVIELHGRQLRSAIRLLESDLREGRDVFQLGYRPDGLDDAMRRLTRSHQHQQRRAEDQAVRAARREAALAGAAFPVAVEPNEETDLLHIRRRLVAIDAAASRGLGHVDLSGFRVFAAVFKYQFRQLRAESRVALLWVFVGPAVLLALISSLYILTGSRYILGMDVPTFSMLGATTWIMFRNIIFRTSTAIYSQRALLNLQPVSSLTIGLAQGSIYALAYAAVFLALIFGGGALGAFSYPADWLAFCSWVAATVITGMATGVLFGASAIVWPYFLRLAPVMERALEIFSGVFFVSEQLPEEYRGYMLWSPLAHALQLMRSGYFGNYKSEDASAEYFFVCLATLIVAALLAYRSVRSRNQPM